MLKLAIWEEQQYFYNEDPQILDEIYATLEALQPQFLELYSACLQAHPHPKILYEKGMILFHQGLIGDALDDISRMIDLAKKRGLKEFLSSDIYLTEGQSYAELGLYDRAVESLTEAIQKNPHNKQAYLERAGAYFELGNFDLSLSDYIQSGVRPQPFSTKEGMDFSLQVTKGILEGGAQAGKEFIPMLLSSLHGLGSGLWAFATDPVTVSHEFAQALKACILFVRDHTPQESFFELVPELRELATQWDDLEPSVRAKNTGYLVGKYGVEIFAGASLAKGVALYRNLKRANNSLTFEAMALSKKNQTLIELEAAHRAQKRTEILKKANLQIQQDKQGKHLIAHRNYNPADKKSIWIHTEPEKLVQKYAGTGFSTGNKMVGTAGYVEIVNFEEFIGYAVEYETGDKVATTWGKIHYAKDGVHLVPIKPWRP